MLNSQVIVNQKYQRIKEYLLEMSKDIDIKDDFIDRFAYNYTNRGQWVSSEWIYEWFCLLGKTTRYNDFCSYYILKLKSSEFKQTLTESFSSEIQHGGQNKQVYEISQKGIKLIMMQADRKTREYYIELEELMFDYIEKKEDELNQTIQEKEQEVKQLQEYIEENKEDYVVYEKEIVGEKRKYRGLTKDIIVRNGQHRRRSCNPYLRKAFEEGKEVKTSIVKRFRSLSRNECKQIERDAILEIPLHERMNIRIPRVHINNNKDDLSLIEEQSRIEGQKQKSQKWEQQYQKYKKFTDLLKRNPKDSSQRDEKLIAKWVYKQRAGYDQLDSEQQRKLSAIEFFKPEVKKINTDDFEIKLKKVTEIYQKEGKLTQAILGSLFHWYSDYSEKIKNNNISQYQKNLFENSGIPLHMKASERWMSYYQQCLDIYKSTGQIPRDKQVDGQFNLGKWVRRQLSECRDELTEEQLKLLADIGVTELKNTSSKQYQILFETFLQKNKRLPKCSDDKDELYLYKWYKRNQTKDVIQTLVNSLNNKE